jgi:diguanylate cyclase (GGDEF)-like protein
VGGLKLTLSDLKRRPLLHLTFRRRILFLVFATVAGLTAILLFVLTSLTSQQVHAAIQEKAGTAAAVAPKFLIERNTLLLERVRRALAVEPRPANLDAFARVVQADSVLILRSGDRALTQFHAARYALKKGAWTGVAKDGSGLALCAVVANEGKAVVASIKLNRKFATDLQKLIDAEVVFLADGKPVASSTEALPKWPLQNKKRGTIEAGGNTYYGTLTTLKGDEAAAPGMIVLQRIDGMVPFFHNLFLALLAAAIGSMVVAGVAGYMVARSVSTSISGVVEAAKQIQREEWPEPIPVTRSDEIGMLQTVFNEMSASLRKSREHLLALIDLDPLTGLANHRKFQEKLDEEVTRTAFTKLPLSLILLDLDHFKEFNGRLGHARGDTALITAAKVVQHCSPEDAVISRYGGEEFAILLPGWDLDRAEILAEKMRSSIQKATSSSGPRHEITASAGCAELTDCKQSKSFLLTAELAVTRAKHLGRNQVCRFDSVPGAGTAGDPYQLQRFLSDGSFATLQAFAAAVDAKDPYTQGHSQRVAEYSRDLAKHMGYDDNFVHLIYTAGTLHDVGKVGVPDEILKKPGRLTDEERAVMETHPVLGEIIVMKVPHLADTLPGVRHHHERWDGKGYPDGLAGEDIPLIGRVLAVADMYDAMTSDRPYRKGMETWEALWEIEKQSGTQLDPILAKSFVAMMRTKFEWTAA